MADRAREDASGDSGGGLGGGGFQCADCGVSYGSVAGAVEQVPKLGPDVLGEEFTVEGGVARLAAYAVEHPEAEIGVVLLNQRVMAGLGNVYKSEVAFAAGVNPFRAMRTVTAKEMEALVDFATRYMKANVADGGRDGASGRRTIAAMDREERLWVYRRQGQECRRCGAAVMMRKQGVQARSTYWCPDCQPWVG